MKKLLALLMAALVLFAMPLPCARAEEEGPVPPVTEAPGETAPPIEPTDAPAPAATPVPSEEPIPTAAPYAGEDPTPTPTPEQTEAPDPTPAPEQTEAPDPAPTPEQTEAPDPAQTPEPSERPSDQPSYGKSLKYWMKQRESITLQGDLREDILIIARSQLGYSADSTCYEENAAGSKRYYTCYGDWIGSKYCDWCDAFVSFCIFFAGNEQYPLDASCTRHMLRLKEAGYWREWNCYVPKKGDIVFFAMGKGNIYPNHVGLVEEVLPGADGQPGRLVTIEGNQRNPDGKTACVRRMVRDLDSVVGYGTYEKGKTYAQACTVRSDGRIVIDEDSIYFAEKPTVEAMEFMGMVGTPYYAYWFPEASETDMDSETEPIDEPQEAGPEAEPDGATQPETPVNPRFDDNTSALPRNGTKPKLPRASEIRRDLGVDNRD